MERVNDIVIANASQHKKGRRAYQQFFSQCTRNIRSWLGLDQPKGYEDYKKQIAEMKEIQDRQKGKR